VSLSAWEVKISKALRNAVETYSASYAHLIGSEPAAERLDQERDELCGLRDILRDVERLKRGQDDPTAWPPVVDPQGAIAEFRQKSIGPWSVFIYLDADSNRCHVVGLFHEKDMTEQGIGIFLEARLKKLLTG